MKPPARLFAAALTLLFVLPACGLFRGRQNPPESKEEEPKGPQAIGTISLVNAEARFVLIHLVNRAAPPPDGFVMRCISPTTGLETGQLIITPEKKGSHMAADIKSGSPAQSDMVIADIGSTKTSAPGDAAAAPSNVRLINGLPDPAATAQPTSRLINGLPDPAADSGAVLTPSQPSGPVPELKPGL